VTLENHCCLPCCSIIRFPLLCSESWFMGLAGGRNH